MINIYRLLDPKTFRMRYIGQTIDTLNGRLRKGYGKTHTGSWIKSLKKKGLVPIIELITTVETTDDANFMETLFIKFYRSLGYDLTNEADGGKVNRGWKHDEESREKMSAWQIGRTLPEEHCANISASLQGNQRALGNKHTDKTKARISITQKGIPKPEGHGAKVSTALIGKPKSEEHCANLSAAAKGRTSPNKGKSMLEEQKEKISATLTGKPWSEARREAYNRRYK